VSKGCLETAVGLGIESEIKDVRVHRRGGTGSETCTNKALIRPNKAIIRPNKDQGQRWAMATQGDLV
jgi:hypothetical protein